MKLIVDIPEEDCAFYISMYKGIPFSEELEKVKQEIEDRYDKEMIKRHANNGYDYQDLLLVGIDIGKNIVDKHITELKGE